MATVHPRTSHLHTALRTLGPADRVTTVRAGLVVVVATLVAASLAGPTSFRAAVTVLAGVVLVLDGVDGWVARRTGTASDAGARFDMEVDAALVLVLSVYVAPSVGGWVLLVGAARYLYAAAALLWPWLRDPVPPRTWRKTVAVVQGVTLAVAASGVLAPARTSALLAAALGLLAVSFGTQAGYVARRRDRSRPATAAPAWTVLAVLLVWLALVLPDDVSRLSPEAFLRLPLEGLVVVAAAVLLPRRARTVVAVGVGVALGLLAVVALLDLGFSEALGRPFDLLQDWAYLDSAFGLLSDSVGSAGAVAASVLVVAVLVGLLVLLPLSVLRLTRAVASQRSRWRVAVPALAVVWVLVALLGVQLAPGAPIASANAVDVARDQVTLIQAGLRDREAFGAALAHDSFRHQSGSQLLTGLRGKDVLVVFVESYGRVAVDGSAVSEGVDRVLDQGTARLRAAGFSARSAFLTSPTFGGISWLAHSTLQSGLWVDSEQRYDDLVSGDRFTLSQAFHRAGWRTVGVVPSNTEDWPEGRSFYGYDQVYDSRNLGYRGPSYSYATMPDQYVLSALERLELARADRVPVMAEVDLVSSHTPWAPLPSAVPWEQVGDGSVFAGQPEHGRSPQEVWRDPDRVRAAYAASIEYSMDSLVSFVETYGDDDLVLVVLGDHQPSTIVSGRGASHDVPVTVVARDPSVMARIGAWHWVDGLRPLPQAPVWRMDAFRDRFLTAYGPRAPG